MTEFIDEISERQAARMAMRRRQAAQEIAAGDVGIGEAPASEEPQGHDRLLREPYQFPEVKQEPMTTEEILAQSNCQNIGNEI